MNIWLGILELKVKGMIEKWMSDNVSLAFPEVRSKSGALVMIDFCITNNMIKFTYKNLEKRFNMNRVLSSWICG
ncbi:hypothetical protein ASF12_23040 [Paenibacillus sp. Leaf72]|nr:hypothetical protein ASF12_23040 [Paenibacillus sp. Leaf72]